MVWCKGNMAISLLEIIRNGDIENAKSVLQQRKYTCIDKQSARQDGTALYWACCQGYYDLVHILLLHGANVNQCTCWGASPLHACADHGHVEILELLLRFGANVNAQTKSGDTACLLSAYRGHGACVQRLVEHRADVDIRNNKRHNALEEAFNRGHYEIYQYLIAVRELVTRNSCSPSSSQINQHKDVSSPQIECPELPSHCGNVQVMADTKHTNRQNVTSYSRSNSNSNIQLNSIQYNIQTQEKENNIPSENVIGVLRLQSDNLSSFGSTDSTSLETVTSLDDMTSLGNVTSLGNISNLSMPSSYQQSYLNDLSSPGQSELSNNLSCSPLSFKNI